MDDPLVSRPRERRADLFEHIESLRGIQRERPEAGLELALKLPGFEATCALSLRARLAPADLDTAVRSLQRSGKLQSLLERYR